MKAVPDVAAALGGVQGDAHLIGENGKAIVFGGAPNIGFSVDPSQPQFNSLTLVKGSWPGHDELVVDESTAGKKDLQVGQTIGVQSRGPVETYRISGIARYGAVSSIGGATLAGFDLPTAQSLFDKVGQLDQIRISAKSGVSPEELVAQVKQILPKDTQVKTGTAQAASDASDTTDFLSVLQKILLGFGLVALFVGAFVIANSLSITIAQRTREFATLRTIGASRNQVLRSVIAEAFVVGVLASLVGLFFGLGLARGLFKLFDVAGLTLPNNGLTLETRTIVVSLALGILVTLLASIYPALRATMVPPIAAVREGATLPSEPLDAIRGTFAAIAVTAAGVATLALAITVKPGATIVTVVLAVVCMIVTLFGCALFPSRTVGALVSGGLGSLHSCSACSARASGRLASSSSSASGCCSCSSGLRGWRLRSSPGSRRSCPRSRAGRCSCSPCSSGRSSPCRFGSSGTGSGARAASETCARVRAATPPRRAVHDDARHRRRDGDPQEAHELDAGMACRLPGCNPGRLDKSCWARERAQEPSANSFHRCGIDDRPRARDARRDARLGDHQAVHGRRRPVLRRGLRDHRSEQLRPDPA